jgi:hypothetical protein
MKSKLLILVMVLSASMSVGRVTAKPVVQPVQQNCETESKYTSMSNLSPKPLEEGCKSDNSMKDNPKPTKKKRHLFIKVALGSIVGLYLGLVIAMRNSKGIM